MGKNKHSLATWQVSLPQLATSNEHVLDSILAFTALHLANLEAWVRLALEYSKEAYSGFAKIISRLSPSTAPSAFVCSVLIALSAMAQHGALGITTGPTYLSETVRLKKLIQGCAIFHNAVHQMELKPNLQSHPRGSKGQKVNIEMQYSQSNGTIRSNFQMNPASRSLIASSRSRVSSLILTRLSEMDDGLHGPHDKIYTETLQSLVDHVHEIHHVGDMFFWL
jgi:hypothetical protein